jgi:hypothetical protein
VLGLVPALDVHTRQSVTKSGNAASAQSRMPRAEGFTRNLPVLLQVSRASPYFMQPLLQTNDVILPPSLTSLDETLERCRRGKNPTLNLSRSMVFVRIQNRKRINLLLKDTLCIFKKKPEYIAVHNASQLHFLVYLVARSYH